MTSIINDCYILQPQLVIPTVRGNARGGERKREREREKGIEREREREG